MYLSHRTCLLSTPGHFGHALLPNRELKMMMNSFPSYNDLALTSAKLDDGISMN